MTNEPLAPPQAREESVPLFVAAIMTVLKEECEREHARAESLLAEKAAAERARDEARKERDEAKARASTLEDTAFHFQSCPTCAQDGEESCTEGRKFAAFLRGESDWEDK